MARKTILFGVVFLFTLSLLPALGSAAYKPEYKLSVVVAQNNPWGGGAQKFADLVRERTGGKINIKYATVASDNAFTPYVLVHEFGHHFAGLADEYYTSDVAYGSTPERPEPWEMNATADPRAAKWKDLVTAGTPIPTPWGLVTMAVADLPVGFLFILAISSLGVYGIALAGWASNNKYSVLGGLRASAQLISYEIAMGLSAVAVLVVAGNITPHEIILRQQEGAWFVLPLFVAFLIFLIAAFAETNRQGKC